MDFVIKLEQPEVKSYFDEGAKFELSFDKVRGKRPNPDTMIVSLKSDYNNTLRFYSEKLENFIAGIKFIGIDDVGLLNELTNIISSVEKVNMKSLNFNSDDGIFEGEIMLYVYDKNHLENLIEKLRNIDSISQVERMEQSDIE